MRFGNLDRCGSILRNAPTVGPGGAVVDSIEPVMQDVWVSKVSITSREIITGARDAVDTESVFICRWFPEMEAGLWFDLEGKRYRITRADELGRREGWQFYAKAIT